MGLQKKNRETPPEESRERQPNLIVGTFDPLFVMELLSTMKKMET